jgi:hypothetical protein
MEKLLSTRASIAGSGTVLGDVPQAPILPTLSRREMFVRDFSYRIEGANRIQTVGETNAAQPALVIEVCFDLYNTTRGGAV